MYIYIQKTHILKIKRAIIKQFLKRHIASQEKKKRAMEFNRHFTKEDIQVANKYIKKAHLFIKKIFFTVGPCWLSILNISVCTCQSQIPNLSFPPTLLPW